MQSVMLLLATLKAIGTAAIMAIAGILATKKGLITNPGRRCLAELSMNIFMPSLLFSSVVSCSEGESCVPVIDLIRESWYLFLFPIVVVGSGILLGFLVACATGCPASFRKGCIGSVAFANSAGMSITLLGVLGPTLMEAGVVETDPLKYQPVYLILYPILQWSVGSFLFGLSGKKQTEQKERTENKGAASDTVTQENPLATTTSSQPPVQTAPSIPVRLFSMAVEASVSVRHSATLAATRSFFEPVDVDLAHEPDMAPSDLPTGLSKAASPNPNPIDTDSVDVESGSSNEVGASETTTEAALTPGCPADQARCPAGGCTFARRAAKGLGSLFRHAVVPPVIGAVLGVVVAAIVPLRALLVDVTNTGGSPPLGLIYIALKSIGRASVPVNMLVLGSNLAQGANLRAVPCATTLGIIFMKQLGQPLMIGAVIFLLARVIEGSMAIFLVMIIMSCTPTANNIMVMVELSGQNKDAMTACIFAQYLAAPVVMTLVITGMLVALQSPWFLP